MALGQYLSGVPDGSGLNDYWNGAKGASAFLFGPTGLDNSIGSYNFLWCVHDPGDIDNTGFGFALWAPSPFCSAI